VKSLYYCRSLSIQRADNVSVQAVAPVDNIRPPANDAAMQLPLVASTTDYEECLACQ
jgi:ribonucleoside-diphosphate reductase alpha chain